MKITFDQFLARARDKHEERFLYDRSSWLSLAKRVRVCCAAHGWFEQVAQTHLDSSGCGKCGRFDRIQKDLNISWINFLARAKFKFDGRYQYDRSSWTGANRKISIHCPEHGWFKQVAYDHLRFNGCYRCANNAMGQRFKERSLQSFMKRSSKIHNGKYEYDFSTWNGMSEKLKIKCQTHGWFEQIPHDHLRATGCTSCGHELAGLRGRLTEKDIIQRFRKTHGDKYDYNNLNYTISSKKLTITCKIHGDFKQDLNAHERGDGCPKCGKRHRWTTEEFVANSIEIHGDKYTYEKSKYKGSVAPITITCKIHGDFTTQPSRHVTRKDGCPQCSPVARLTQDDFLARARKRFGDRYDYSLVEFVNVATPVKIVCKIHGVFEQPPTYHLNNAIGCGECSYNVSTKETKWLDGFTMSAKAKRNTTVKLKGRRRNVDAFDPESKTVYEFWGDWWHGHPDFFDPKDIHPKTGTTFGELYQKTLEKRTDILEAGYTLVEIWEHEFDKM